MDVRNLNVDVSKLPLMQTVERVKRARATMMRSAGPSAYVYFHREIEVEHDDSQFCICDPVTIGQNDYRPSLYFAHQIHYPVLH